MRTDTSNPSIAALALSLLLHSAVTADGVSVGGRPEPGSSRAGVAWPAQTGTLRETVNLNRAWRFQLGDHAGAERPSYDDSGWSPVGLPHSFSIPYFMSARFYTGSGWYRRHVTVPAAWAQRRVFIEFQGAFQDARVYVNGAEVGRHLGGYTGFSRDITRHLAPGDNVIALRLNNEWNPRVAPRGGDHTFSGGIYRDVFLVVTDPVHVTWYGTFVTTPTLAASAGSSSTVNIRAEVRNDRPNRVDATVRTDIVDSRGAVVATVSSRQVVPAGSTVTFDQTTSPIDKPRLWHPDHPTLYTALTTVSDGRRAVDTFTTPFGFRWFRWTADDGFHLNGSRYYLRGANVHQDQAGWGDAVTDAALYRDVQLVKEAGFNFIRGSHYPKDPAFSAACDSIGVLFWSENALWGSVGGREGAFTTAGTYPPNAADQDPFDANVLEQLGEMIRVHRNHPSVIAWSVSNEPFFTARGTSERMRALLGRSVALAHQLDPTRPAAVGGAQRPVDENRIDKLGDVAGYNGDGATIAAFQDPGIPNLVTEYNNVSAVRPGNYDPGWGDLRAQLAAGLPTQYPWRSGETIWCMFDHGSHYGMNMAIMGIVDYFRIPKRSWHWYRNAYAHVPPPPWPEPGTPAGLALTASTRVLAAVDGTTDAQLTVTVVDSSGRHISNNVPVTLTVTSGPGEFPTGPSITFTPPSSDPQSDIALLDGQAAIAFRTYYSGRSTITATSPGLRSASITITSHGSPAFVPGETPPSPVRPYVRFANDSLPQDAVLTLALDHPTRASSTAGGTPASANDGDPGSAWLAESGDSSSWWQVNLEQSRTLNTIELTFPAAGNYRYTIAVSSNGVSWTTVVDESHGTNTARTRRVTGSFGSFIQYLRVSFAGLPPGQPAGLAEVVLGGT